MTLRPSLEVSGLVFSIVSCWSRVDGMIANGVFWTELRMTRLLITMS